jgi:hypothetical protein
MGSSVLHTTAHHGAWGRGSWHDFYSLGLFCIPPFVPCIPAGTTQGKSSPSFPRQMSLRFVPDPEALYPPLWGNVPASLGWCSDLSLHSLMYQVTLSKGVSQMQGHGPMPPCPSQGSHGDIASHSAGAVASSEASPWSPAMEQAFVMP